MPNDKRQTGKAQPDASKSTTRQSSSTRVSSRQDGPTPAGISPADKLPARDFCGPHPGPAVPIESEAIKPVAGGVADDVGDGPRTDDEAGSLRIVETVMRESETRLRRLADALPQLVWTANAEGDVNWYNSRVQEYAGLTRCGDGRWIWQPVLHPDDHAKTVATWRAALASGDVYQCEHRLRLADGSLRWHLSRAVPRSNDAGEVVEWFGTATDIHDLKRAQEALRKRSRRKDAFLATLAHELRNPLAPIRTAVELLGLQRGLDADGITARDLIDRQSRHLVRLVDDLVDMSRLTRGRLQLRRESIGLEPVVEQAVQSVRPRLDASKQTLEVVLPSPPVQLFADPDRLAQVLVNLLDNASKFSESGSCLRLIAERDEGQLALCVIDTGVGISAAELPWLFDVFSRGRDARPTSEGVPARRDPGGLGIGLALSKYLVELHGGSIVAHSEGAGQGAEVCLRLPLRLPASPAAVAPVGVDHLRRPTKTDAEPRPNVPPAIAATPLRILVADDNVDIVDSLALLLEIKGHRVVTAGDGEEAAAVASRGRFDAILMDIGMPKLDGLAACRRIRAQEGGDRLRIIAMTGWGQDSDRSRSLAAGFDGHLVKPIATKELFALLERIARG